MRSIQVFFLFFFYVLFLLLQAKESEARAKQAEKAADAAKEDKERLSKAMQVTTDKLAKCNTLSPLFLLLPFSLFPVFLLPFLAKKRVTALEADASDLENEAEQLNATIAKLQKDR